jgi:hypothetical protein
MNKHGIAIETTCDGYSSIKAMISNNTPIIYCGAKMWGKKFTIYSPFAADQTAIQQNIKNKAIANYKDKINMLKAEFVALMNVRDKFTSDNPLLNRLGVIKGFFTSTFNNNCDVFFNSACKLLNSFNCNILTTSNAIQALYQNSENGVLTGRDINRNNQFQQSQINFINAKNSLSTIFEQRLSIVALFIMLEMYVGNILIYYNFLEFFEDKIDALLQASSGISGDEEDFSENLNFVNKLLSLLISLDILYNVESFLNSCQRFINQKD